jgi:hypothetical protein
MAIFHLNAKVISRGKGQSAIAAAAYRSGERLRDEQAGEQKYYASRAERIQFTDIMAPKDAPEWAHDRNQLWNQAERAEKRRDAQLAREIEVSLPHELSEQQREWLVKDFAREAFVRKGYAVDIAIHAPDKDGSDERNYHAHLMVTMRTLGPEGFAPKKDPSMNRREQLGEWREDWAHLANRHLERHGFEARIDHRSLEAQGIDREATLHLGYAANEMAQRGAQSDRMDELRDILARNEIRTDMKAIAAELKALERAQAQEERRTAEIEEQARRQQEARRQSAREREEIMRERSRSASRDTAEARPQARAGEPPAAKTGAARAEQVTREEALQKHARADQADREALRHPAERAYGEGARQAAKEAGQEARQERREAALWAKQEAWREDVAAHGSPKATPAGAAKGLRVTDPATGLVSGLADFMTGLLAGAPPAPGPGRSDMAAFVSDPEARKEQQLARLAAARAAKADQKALEHIEEDMKAGRNLSAADIRKLTRDHQEQIRAGGDAAVVAMVDDARRRSEDVWKGKERERDW